MKPSAAWPVPDPGFGQPEHRQVHGVSLLTQPDRVVCDECDAVHERIALRAGQVARCRRCDALLGRGHLVTPTGQLAFALAALVFLAIGNLTPMVTLELHGLRIAVTVPHAIALTWRVGQPLVALLAAATALIFPLMLVLLRIYVLVFLTTGRVPAGFQLAMRALKLSTYWSMVEVFMLSALVAIVRSAGLASLTPGVGLFAYGVVTLLLTSITAAGLHSMWKLSSDLEEEAEAREAGP
jgi:paraquat-inducible protein A